VDRAEGPAARACPEVPMIELEPTPGRDRTPQRGGVTVRERLAPPATALCPCLGVAARAAEELLCQRDQRASLCRDRFRERR
jgi:hypothetical protein